MESFEDCARREVMEETGIEIHNIFFLRLMNLKEHAPKRRRRRRARLLSVYKRGRRDPPTHESSGNVI